MNNGHLVVKQSFGLHGQVALAGAKNAILVTIASLLLVVGKSILYNVPCSDDVFAMIELLRSLGAEIFFDTVEHSLIVDTTFVYSWTISSEIMRKTRTSALVMGPLLARFGKVVLGGVPGGDAIGARPLDYHIKNFEKMGVRVLFDNGIMYAQVENLQASRLVLEYPSVGATENSMMLAVCVPGITTIVNAACGEPEVRDLIAVLTKMGAKVSISAPSTLIIEGICKDRLTSIEHVIMCDRLEAGSLLIATAASGGTIELPDALIDTLDMVVVKLEEMGHTITVGAHGKGISLQATTKPRAVNFKTGPFPGFPTDLQAPMMALQCTALGVSVIEETVFENRFHHVHELKKMGANIVVEGNKAIVTGVHRLQGTSVVAADIRASMALVVAGLVANGTTIMYGINHWKRGYDALEKKLEFLGAHITLNYADSIGDVDKKIIIEQQI